MRSDLSDEEWALFELLLPKSRKRARTDDRKIKIAIFYALRTGMPSRDLPTAARHQSQRASLPHAGRRARAHSGTPRRADRRNGRALDRHAVTSKHHGLAISAGNRKAAY